MSVRILHGDMLAILPTLDACSMDSCVTDPPYHLQSIHKRFAAKGRDETSERYAAGAYGRHATGFMGKQWDGGDIASRVETWAEVYRVLKPGAHLLAFGGTRTFHRMVCAIEDAGFEIRDTIFWVFGSGFPKSHNISNALSDISCSCDIHQTESDTVNPVRDVRRSGASVAVESEAKRGGLLHCVMPEQDFRGKASHDLSARGCGDNASAPREGGNEGAEKPSLERRCDLSQPEGKLRERPVCSMPAGPDVHGTTGRLRNGASSGDGTVDQASVDSHGMRPSHRSPTTEQSGPAEPGTMAGQSQPQAGGAWPLCDRCDKPIIPRGLGTALKPAAELICVARKPMSERTVAANVLRHGCGAINVDGCRVGFAEGDTTASAASAGAGKGHAATRDKTVFGNGLGGVVQPPDPLGRWPANVIHDGSEEVLQAFPDAPGQQRYVGPEFGEKKSRGIYGDFGTMVAHEPRDQGGTAARFFYAAKADKSDRLASKHPTVKPVDLIRYLIRLVTPPGGTVLDCFAGSGTTGMAALAEGFNAVLVEREAEYVADIRRRVAHVEGADTPLFA